MVTSEIIETVKDRLIKAYNPRAVYLFGSFAWGTPDEHSDLDLLVVIDSSDEKPYKRLLKGIDALTGLGIAKDLLVYTRTEFEELANDVSTLCHKIKQEGVKLYEVI
ncbi:MAG: nucleotidyltransferase domain-containing protein [Planctomycetes bacterium]|nr:nucleotidyltransferase domain-containing protein [Planctomycetota bacterium]